MLWQGLRSAFAVAPGLEAEDCCGAGARRGPFRPRPHPCLHSHCRR